MNEAPESGQQTENLTGATGIVGEVPASLSRQVIICVNLKLLEILLKHF